MPCRLSEVGQPGALVAAGLIGGKFLLRKNSHAAVLFVAPSLRAQPQNLRSYAAMTSRVVSHVTLDVHGYNTLTPQEIDNSPMPERRLVSVIYAPLVLFLPRFAESP